MFSAISIKRMNYLLPIVPAAGVLAAWYFCAEGVREDRLLRAERLLMGIGLWVAVVLGVALVACVTAAGPLLHSTKLAARTELSSGDLTWLQAYFSPWRALLAAALTAPAIVAAVMGLRTPARSGRRKAAFLAAAMVLFFVPVAIVINPAGNVFKSGRRFGEAIKQHAVPGKHVYLYENNFSGVYNLYSGIVNMPQIDDAAQLQAILAAPDTLVVGEAKQLGKVLSSEEKARHLVYSEGVGHREMLLLKGLAPPRAAGRASSAPNHGLLKSGR